MNGHRPVIAADVVVAQGLLILALTQIAMREAYHRVAAEPFAIVLALFASAVLWGAAVAAGRWLREPAQTLLGRLMLIAATALGAYLIAGNAVLEAPSPRGWPSWAGFAAAGLLLAAALMAARFAPPAWSRLRRLVLVAALLFVGSQPVLTRLLVRDVNWPPAPMNDDAGAARSATIFLLLDELNAGASEPLVQVLREHGLQVRFKAIEPVGDGTAKVVPAMFTDGDFGQARPCGLSTICSGNRVLDFARVHATRSDIDVVGFFHPYCEIQGLRWCQRAGVPISLIDPTRWRCAAWRRFGVLPVKPAERCDELHARGPVDMLDELVEALWRAPLWQQGGFLYAHLPLPHPPGVARSNLQREYRDNLERTVSLLRQMLARARANGLQDLRVVIFSDHPLRQALWCRSYFPYARQGCTVDAALEDSKVPLIAAGLHPPELDAIERNAQVFGLAAAGWR